MKVTKAITFDAAHQLQSSAWKNSPCHRLHGHTWRVEATYEGPVSEKSNSIVDFQAVGDALKHAIHDRLDHQFINDVLDVQDATSEYIVQWMWAQLEKCQFADPVELVHLRLFETATCWVDHDGRV
jgi:6-pyruvoyltetrahydropterin/6-carboxytetrahydropterin synthase